MRALPVKPWNLMIKTSKNHLPQARRMATPWKAEKNATGPQEPQRCKRLLGCGLPWQAPSCGVRVPRGVKPAPSEMAAQQGYGLWNQTPSSTTHWLCDPRQVTQPLCVSVPHL